MYRCKHIPHIANRHYWWRASGQAAGQARRQAGAQPVHTWARGRSLVFGRAGEEIPAASAALAAEHQYLLAPDAGGQPRALQLPW